MQFFGRTMEIVRNNVETRFDTLNYELGKPLPSIKKERLLN